MNSFSIRETMENFADKAVDKSRLAFWKMALLGIMAGAFIALGFLAFVRVGGTVPKEWGSFGTFLGACLFPAGLLAIVFLGGELATGNAMVMMFGVLEKKIKLSDMAKNWALVFLFNIVGGVLVAWFFGHVLGLTEGDFAAKTIAVGSGKVKDTVLQMIVSGIGCDIFVCMAVWLGSMSKDFLGRFVGVWFPIMIFVTCGFQHCVANAFIIPASMFAGADISLAQCAFNLLIVFIGNEIGGALFLALPVWLSQRPASE